ncbi:hypothetical protein niasHT_037913 [Heterodera trifolii]|uniref:Uncharacterized protein n=1 Tax=Heterodera trifolii TaxID=157864 RepID=A0ABD2I483_9BILA
MCSSPNYLRLANVLFRNYGAMKNFERCAEKCRVVHAEKGRLKVEMELGEETREFARDTARGNDRDIGGHCHIDRNLFDKTTNGWHKH